MLIRSQSLDRDALSPFRRELLFLIAASIAMASACSLQVPNKAHDIPTIMRQVKCIALTEPGLSSDLIDRSLVDLAVADAKRQGRSIRLYKVVPGTAGSYYIFDIGGWSDIYTVYQTDRQGSQFVGKYQYGSLHYPCPAASDSIQPQQPPSSEPIKLGGQ